MTALTFPDSPSLNEIYTQNNKSWKWNGASWSNYLVPGNDRAQAWSRNSMWLELPVLTESDQKFAGLHAVYEFGSNFCALSAEGNYTVNWGDGTGDTNVNSGVTAETNISWANAASTSDVGIADAVSCTFQDSGNTITVVGHDFQNRERIAFNIINSTTGISTYTTYYVVNVSGNTFQVESSVGGGAIGLTTDGTGSVYRTKYRQVIVTVVPNGTNLTKLNLHIRHSQSGLYKYVSGFLDIIIAGQYLTDFRVGVSDLTATTTISPTRLEQINIVKSDLRQLRWLFQSCVSLASVVNLSTSTSSYATSAVTFQDTGDTVTWNSHGFRDGDQVIFSSITSTSGIAVNTFYYVRNITENTFQLSDTWSGSLKTLTTDGSGTAVRGTIMGNLFRVCESLESIPLIDTSNVIDMSYMFLYGYSLTSIPLLDTSKVFSMDYMFAQCKQLQTIPLLDTSSVKTMSYMFSGCSNLKTIPLIDTSSVKNTTYMFNGCTILETIPLIDTSSVTLMQNMFNSCYSLKSVPLINTSLVTNMSGMFIYCYCLETVPAFDTSSCSVMGSMFEYCEKLKYVPKFNTSACGDFSSMFSACTSLEYVPALNCAAPGLSSGLSSMFYWCYNLSRIDAYGFDQTFTVSSCKLSAEALNALYTGLGTGTGKTITVSGNWGVASDDPTIATAKGWAVTG